MSRAKGSQRKERRAKPEVVEQVRRIRAERRAVWWSRPLGFLMLAAAGVTALHPEYPMPAPLFTPSSAPSAPGLRIRLLAGPGDRPMPSAVFRWDWPEGSGVCDFVVLDEAHYEVFRVQARTPEFVADGDVLQRLENLGAWHWRVEAMRDGSLLSSPVASCGIFR